MLARSCTPWLAILLVSCAACGDACGATKHPIAKPASTKQASDRSAAATTPAPAAEPKPDEPAPVAVVPAKPVPEGAPRKHVRAEGIQITETSDGRVILQTTTTWGEAIDTTYSDCSFYRAAIPVLEGQLTASRAKLLPRVCTSKNAPASAKSATR